MLGETISHYRIVEELGSGAMGVVYKAQDLRLKRFVALKFLPAGLTRDPDAKARFVQEAEAASALDDPHVCTVYDIDEDASGRVFIAMAYYEGQSLKRLIQDGPVPLDTALSLARQIASGLAAAHQAGIVHRDIKPANVMVTSKFEAKVVDFGIAKLAGTSDLTGTGLRLGTIAYMAPEQFDGEVDGRADLWALGVVLFEMLAGRRPFDGTDDVTTMNAVLHRAPAALKTLRPDVPDRVVAVIDRALQKDPAKRFATATDMADAIAACQAPATRPAAVDDTGAVLRTIRRPVVALPTLAVVGAIGYVLVSTQVAQSQARWAREEAIPEIQRLLQNDEYAPAYDLAGRAERAIPGDPVLIELASQITQTPKLTTTPEGARVSVRPYTAPDADWRLLGTTPLDGPALPRGAYVWKIEAPGYTTLEFARNVSDFVTPRTVELIADAEATAGMVPVPATSSAVGISGFATEDPVRLAAFDIGRTEVTNRQFKEFVDAGGYTTRAYWTHDVVRDGRTLSWPEVMAIFVDSSGRPGPATWELGTYPTGQDEFPVGGISWYEAEAYAAFRGVRLPTFYHWARAALQWTNGATIRGNIVDASNFSGRGPVAVGTTHAMGPYGTVDMAGNVREWCVNASGDDRWILGGAWTDGTQVHMMVTPNSLPPLDRSATNGVRLAKFAPDERLAELEGPVEVVRRDFRNAKPVSDEVFEVFKRQLSYTPSPVDAKPVAADASSPDWTHETVSIDTGYGERMLVHLFVPKAGRTPRQAVVFVPGLGQFLSRTASPSPAFVDGFDFFVKSGRILVMPVMKGSYERFDGFVSQTGDRNLQGFRQHVRDWRQEMGQLLDYLQSRDDVQGDEIAYSGVSFGASTFLPLLAVEPRFKAAVLYLAGLSYRDMLPEVDAVNFVSRITIPTLMLEARYDHLFPVLTSQEPLMALLGSPPDQKRQVLYDGGHGLGPRGLTIHESLTWLDKYLGPVE